MPVAALHRRSGRTFGAHSNCRPAMEHSTAHQMNEQICRLGITEDKGVTIPDAARYENRVPPNAVLFLRQISAPDCFQSKEALASSNV